MTNWTNALNQRASDRKFQPNTGQGSQRAGLPGMGGGPIPYAKGMTQTRPNTEPARHISQPQGSQPGPSGGGAPSAAPPMSSSPAGGRGGQFDPAMVLAYANYLMNHFRNATFGNRGYRG